MQRPLILVTNDDSIVSPGIRTLISIMKEIGDVIVVAPDSPQSGMGHAITINNTLHLDRVYLDKKIEHEYSCSGTPVDCVKFALDKILTRRPDIVVSGINHGANSSINVIYSGIDIVTLYDLPTLKTLSIWYNNLTELDLSNLSSLLSLNCYQNSITNLDISMLTNLNTLTCKNWALLSFSVTDFLTDK